MSSDGPARRVQQGTALGIGLHCRVEGGCVDSFRAIPSDDSSRAALEIAAALRNEHELEAHGYTHPVYVPPKSVFGASPTGGRKPRLIGVS